MARDWLDGLDYAAQRWQVGDPITQGRMTDIENAIESAFARLGSKANSTDLNSLNSTVSGHTTDIDTIKNTTIPNLADKITQNTSAGSNAWSEIGSTTNNHEITLAQRLENIIGLIDAAKIEINGTISQINASINTISDGLTAVAINVNGAKRASIGDGDSLNARFESVETTVSSHGSAIATLNNSSGSNYQTLAERLAAIDNNQLGGVNGFRPLPDVDTEIKNARGIDDNNEAYSTLSARLSAIDTKITNVKSTSDSAIQQSNISHVLNETNINKVLGADQGPAITAAIANAKSGAEQTAQSYADTYKIAKTSIYNGLDKTADDGSVLDARQGKALKDAIDAAQNEINAAHYGTDSDTLDKRFDLIDGGSAPSRTLPNLITEVENARVSSVIRTPGANDGDPDTDTTYGSLDARLEAIEAAAAVSDTAIDGRLDTLEANVNGAKVQDGPQTLDARFDAVESRATTLETKVTNIANELSMTNIADQVLDTTSRIDTLETNVVAMANEIGMLQNGAEVQDMASAITGATTRIDSLETEVGEAHRAHSGHFEEDEETHEQVELNDTLDLRFDDIESDIDDINDKIGGNYDSSNTVTAAIEAAITTAETYTDTQNTNNKVAQINGANREHSGHFIEDEETHEQVEIDDTLDLRFEDIEERLDAIDTPSTGTIAGLDRRIGTLEGTINTANTGLSARMSNAESAITTLQTTPKSATVVIAKERIVYNNEGVPTVYENDYVENGTNTPITPSNDVDYLFETEVDNEIKYFYWKYIDDNWELISGGGIGGGTGSSSGMFVESLDAFEGEHALTPDKNIDYFVGTNNTGYTHYRYLVPEGAEIGTFVRILPKGLLQNVGVTANGGLVGYTVENSSTNVFNNFVAFKDVDAEPVMDGQTQTGTRLTFTDTNGVGHAVTVSGGGGGAGSAYTVKLNNETGSLSLTVPDTEGQVTTVSARALVKEGTDIAENLSSILTVTTQYSTSRDGPWSTLESRIVENNTPFSVDVSSILRTGIKMYVRLTLTTRLDEQDFTRPITYEITKVKMSIAATNFNPAVVRTGNLVFQYKCIGSGLQKTVHFKIDGIDAVTPVVTDSHDEPLQQTIPLVGREVGMHSFEVYFTVGNVSSNILNYYILYNNNTTNTLPMIALAAEKATITYGDELKINYTTAVNSNVEFMDDVLLELYTIDSETDQEVPITHTELTDVRNERVHTWIPVDYPTEGTVYIRGTASRTIEDQVYTYTKTIRITVNKLITKYSLTYAGEDNLLYSYTAYGRTNQDLGKEVFNYTYTSQDTGNPTITWTGAFNNFNWATDGYADGQTLTVSGGATHTIDVPLFDSKKGDISLEVDPKAYTDPTQNGRTIEIEYEVQSATDLNDTIIDCMDNNHVGFRVTPQSCYLLNNNVNVSFANDGTGTILNEDAIAAAYLTTGVRTHLAFVIEPWAEEKAYDKKYHQSVNIYINGEFANACPYNRDNSTGNISDSFKTNATIRIGSASCIIKIYSIKMYNRGLTNTEILQNYKMAPGKTRDKLARFENNDVLEGGAVDYELARKKFNCLLLVGPQPEIRQNDQGQDYNTMPTISPYKGAPSPIGRTKDGEVVGKTESGLILTYPDGNSIDGYKTEFSLLDMMSDGGYASSNNVQGTSSQKYPVHNLKVYLMKGTAGKEVYDTTVDILTRNVNASSITAAATTAYRSVYPLPEVEEGEEVEEINTELPEYITNCAEAVAQTVQSSTELMTQAEVVTAIINYLTNEDAAVGAAYTSTGDELVIDHPFIGYSKSEKVKYKLPGSKGKGESTLCWKADYMSTDHANTYNANIADSLFTDSLNPNITNEDWQANVQNTVHGIRCLLFKQEGTNPPEFVSDGCLNNDKGNSATYGLEYSRPKNEADVDPNAEYDVKDTADTVAQKWEFTNNSDDLGFFKYDCVFYPTGNDNHYRALDAFESCWPDQGDLEDAQDAYKAEHNNEEDPNLNPNYNHLQVLLTWVSQRANYWDADPTPTGTVTYNEEQGTYSTTGTVYTYNDIPYSNMRDYKKAIFKTEFTRHFNLDHVLVYYLFSEYTALCDNRVKNMFMRSDTIRSERIKLLNGDTIFEGNANPNADFWKTYTSITTRGINTGSIVSAINAAYTAIHENDEVEEGEEPPTEAAFAEAFANSISAAAQESENILTEEQVIALIKSELAELEDEDAATIATMYDTYSDGKEVVIEHRVRDANLIDWETGEGHSNFAIWAPVLYDLDSCFGVENVGLLKIPYNADWQYFSEGQYRFNGHDSIFWLMVEDTFQSELAAKALTLYNRSRGLNYNTFYQEQVVDNINETAPAMTNQDMILKYDDPWATGFMNYANKPPTYETPEYKYLQRGTRTAQKTSFLFQRSMLLSSKYQASAFLNDKISFRYGADLSAAQGVIECTANQIMYPAVSFGDNKGWTQALELVDGTPVVNGLVQAGQKCRIRATSSAKGQDTLFIAGASVLTDIGDLSVFKPYELKVGQGKNLKKLIIGSNASGYTNAVTSTIENLSACSILEEINIRNCTAFTNLDVSANGLIKRIYAAGSGAGTISLPSGGVLTNIEYSAATSNVTILNHGYLQTCTFEIEDGEETPQYSNLNKLWVENTPNVPVVDMVIKRMGSLTNGLRLVGIDIDLGNDPTFLQTITSTLADGKYLDSAGSLNNSETPWIAGKVHISEIRASLLNKIHNMYPELIVYNVMDNEGNISNNIVAEYSVEYQNYDGTVLYTDNRTNTENYIDPVFDTNPITGEPYIPMPTKPADAQYKYRFGTYNARTGKYNRYSGWVRKGTNTNPNSSQTVNGNTIFVAVYPTTEIQTYTVTWYDKYNGTARQEMTVNYGTDLSSEPSPIEQGTLAKVDQSGNQIKVFNGWSRPLGKITEDLNVYALWETSSINENTEDVDMSTLSAADVYALSLVSNEKKADLLSDKLGTPIFIPMGQDFNYVEGTSVINLLGTEPELTFDGSTDDVIVYNGTGTHTEVRPLATNSDWTLAIDYKFLMDSAESFAESPEFVLASCYKNANSTINGFKLSLIRNLNSNPTIQVSWGTETLTIDYAITDTEANRYFTSYRNVVVLSHNSDSPNILRVSYVAPNTNNSSAPIGANYGTYVSNVELTYTTSTIDTPLIFGGNYAGATTSFESSSSTRAPAQGIIYWAKFWNVNLGELNCSKLASWPHETVPFYLSGFNGTNEISNKKEQIYANTELSFVAAQGLGDRYIYSNYSQADVDENTLFGWHLSEMRSICNNVLYQGMPESYKSIIRLSHIASAARDPYATEGEYTIVNTDDYLFLPAYREVQSTATALGIYGNEVNTQWASPWSWMVPADIQILEYVTGQTTNVTYKTAQSINVFRYRFLGAYIKPTAKIFNIPDDPTSKTNLRIQRTGQASEAVVINSGDIWIKNNVAYMYFTANEIDTGITVDDLVSNANYQGGWKRCDMWNLRTHNANIQNISENLFLRVKIEGDIDESPSRSQYREYGRLLCPEFTI